MLHGQPPFDAPTLPELSRLIRQATPRPLRNDLSKAAGSLLGALLVREPMMRVGPRQMTCVYLPKWGKETGVL